MPPVSRTNAISLCALLSAAALACGTSSGEGSAADGGSADDAGSGDTGTASLSPIRNPSFESASTPGSGWISGAESWTAGGSVRRVTDLPSLVTDGLAVMRIGAGQSSMNDLCFGNLSYVAQPDVDLSRAAQLQLDFRVVGTMTYSSLPADIVLSVGLQHTGNLWERRYTPPSSGYASLDERGTATIAIPSGVQSGELSIAVQYVGAVGVDVEECVIAYVDNLRVR